MKNVYIASIIAVLLAACGGGGSSAGSTPTPTSTSTPPSPSSTTPPPPTTQTYVAPAVPASAVKLTTRSFEEGGTSDNYTISFSGAVDLTVSGRLDNLWLLTAQPGGTATVSGDMNTIVFMPGVSAQVTVTGSGNTFYLPVGSSVTITGSGAATSTIRYYTS